MDIAPAPQKQQLPLRPPPGAERLTPWVVGGALFLQTLDATIVSTALPTMARALNEPILRLNSTITIYLLASAIFIPISGWLADRFGSKAVFRAAILLFTAASLLCGFASDLNTLVAARFLQGAAGAMITPVGRLLIVQRHDKSDLVRAMAFLGIPIVVGPVVGPPLGGFIVQYFSWHWIFFVNLPIGVAMMILVQKFITDIPPAAAQPLDLRGFLFAGLGAASLVYGLSLASERGSPMLIWFSALFAGAALAGAYVLHARGRASAAILDLNVLRTDTFRTSLIGSVLLRMGTGATPFMLALLLQLQLGMHPLDSGLVTLSIAAAALLMKTTAQPIIKRFGYKRVLIANTIVTAAALMLWGLLQTGTPLPIIVAALLVGGFFRSLQFTALNTLIFADLQSSQASRASSLAAMIQQLADSVGIAVCAIILSIAARPGAEAPAISLCFFFLGAANLLALPLFFRMPAGAGDQVRGQ